MYGVFVVCFGYYRKVGGKKAEGERSASEVDGEVDDNVGEGVASVDSNDACWGGMVLEAVEILFVVGYVLLSWPLNCGWSWEG